VTKKITHLLGPSPSRTAARVVFGTRCAWSAVYKWGILWGHTHISHITVRYINRRMLTCALRAHVKKINVEKIYWTCGVFNSLNIKFFVSLNAIFLFLDSLTCALCAQVNMTHINITKESDLNNVRLVPTTLFSIHTH
jgi:hypothetical protein